MIDFTVAEVAEICGADISQADMEFFVKTIPGQFVIDNRQVRDGDIFIALPGEQTDGNKYAHAALASGAAAVITSNAELALASGAKLERLIVVKDAVLALGDLARAWLVSLRERNSELRVIGITGSVGKTTTKDLLAALVSTRGNVVAPPNSFNNEIGLALTVLRADTSTATLVLEMGADRIGNIEYLTQIAPPDISIVLKIAEAHLGTFGSVANVVQAKSELATGTRESGVVILNADDERIASMKAVTAAKVKFFSSEMGNSQEFSDPAINLAAWATDVADDAGHAVFNLQLQNESARVRLGLAGLHLMHNALAAALAASELGIPLVAIVQALQGASPVSPHRMDVFELADCLIIDDAYNANPTSMRAGIAALGSLGADYQRRIAVIGSMLEQGEHSDSLHVQLLPYLQQASVDYLVAVGEETAPLAKAAREAGLQVEYFSSYQDALSVLDSIRAGDAVLFKGSNGTQVWQLADTLRERLSVN
ncbi:MAG: UDP-N-acetylmuramoyl-tripeptide--D-alanyl-D-alanine ligase [Arcanobacterium sp.]|nr:UDP-N-acetylmuramoyl-tripeptide--D-alanyl-D-alanine ligase [Arcanobacterium sp.]